MSFFFGLKKFLDGDGGAITLEKTANISFRKLIEVFFKIILRFLLKMVGKIARIYLL